MGEVLGDTVPGMRRFILPLKEDTVDVGVRLAGATGAEPDLAHDRLLGGSGHPGLPDPHDFVDESWDPDDRWDLVTYLRSCNHRPGVHGLLTVPNLRINNGASWN